MPCGLRQRGEGSSFKLHSSLWPPLWLFKTPSLPFFSCLVCLQPGSVTCVPKASPTPSPLPSATADAPGALCPAGSYCAPGTTFVSVLHALAHLSFSSSLTSHDQRHVTPWTVAAAVHADVLVSRWELLSRWVDGAAALPSRKLLPRGGLHAPQVSTWLLLPRRCRIARAVPCRSVQQRCSGVLHPMPRWVRYTA